MDTQQLEELRKAHKRLGACLDGSCDHRGVGKCMAQMKASHSTMGGILDSEAGLGDGTENEKFAKLSKDDPNIISKTIRAIRSSAPVSVD